MPCVFYHNFKKIGQLQILRNALKKHNSEGVIEERVKTALE